jgi:tetratricopeptide (TPR) repeat protein
LAALLGLLAQSSSIAQLVRDPGVEEAYKAGKALLDEGKYKEAITELTKAIKADPTYAEALVAAGQALNKQEEYQPAAVLFTRALDVAPDSAEAYNGLGEANMEQGFNDMALNAFSNALERDRNNAQVLSNLGHVIVDGGQNPNAAIGYLDDAIEMNDKDARAHRDRGLAYAQLRDFKKSVADLEQAIQIEPQDYENYSTLATIHQFQEDYAPATEALSKAIETYKPKKRTDPETFVMGYIMRADARLRTGEKETDPAKRQALFEAVLADAQAVLNEYEDRYPESGLAYYRRGRAERMLERYSNAVDSFTLAIQVVPANESASYMSDAYLYRGICWFYIGSLDLARLDFDRASGVGNGFNDPRVYLWTGITYHKQGDFREAIDKYSEAIAKQPNFPLAYINRGRAYMDLKEFDKAIESFNAAIGVEPSVGEYYYNVGVAYNEMEDWQKAVDFLNLAVRKENPQPKMYRALATALRGLGRDELAEEYEQKAGTNAEDATGG